MGHPDIWGISRAGMTPEQRRVLGPSIKAMVRHNKHVWWELKRQIFESGAAAGAHHWESIYKNLAHHFIGTLTDQDKAILVTEWRRENMEEISSSDEGVLIIHSAIVAEEIVRRAEIASNRTINW